MRELVHRRGEDLALDERLQVRGQLALLEHVLELAKARRQGDERAIRELDTLVKGLDAREAGETVDERRAFGVDERSQFEAERRRESRWCR